jgi:predicted TIM-barrel fold metal-dependent hydrolase
LTTIPPPDPDPHAPTAVVPPPGACDAHCHVFGPADRFPFAPDRRYTPPDAGVDDMMRLHARLGMDRAVIVQASCHGTDHAALLDALRRGEGRYAGVAMIDEVTPEAELDELHEAGVRGTRVNFVAHLGGAPDPRALERIVARAADRGWHLDLHLDAADVAGYAPLLALLPCPYIIDHMGRVDATGGLDQEPFRALLALLHEDEHCWVKLSGAERITADGPPPYDDVVPFAQALIAAAPDRLLWGTDWPHPNVRHMPDDGDLVDLLAAFAPDGSARHRILVENPERLYFA